MQIDPTAIPDVLILTPRRFGDARGWFMETWNAARMADAGLDLPWVQDNHSFSAAKGTLRGLHYQSPPARPGQAGPLHRGARSSTSPSTSARGSPTYGQLGRRRAHRRQRRASFSCRKGFLHGFVTLTDDTEVQYKCTDLYDARATAPCRWDDPTIGIDWGIDRADPVGQGRQGPASRRHRPRPSATGRRNEAPGHRRRRLHRLRRRAPGRSPRPRGRQPRRPDLCREPRQRRPRRRLQPLQLRASRHPRPRRARPHLRHRTSPTP